jgi:hypothetical protein
LHWFDNGPGVEGFQFTHCKSQGLPSILRSQSIDYKYRPAFPTIYSPQFSTSFAQFMALHAPLLLELASVPDGGPGAMGQAGHQGGIPLDV